MWRLAQRTPPAARICFSSSVQWTTARSLPPFGPRRSMMKRPSIAPRRSRSSTLASSPSWRTASARGARFSRRSRSRAPRRSSASTAGSAPPGRGDCVPRRGARPRVPSADCASTTADRRAGRRSSSFTATAPRSRTGRRRSFTCVRRAASGARPARQRRVTTGTRAAIRGQRSCAGHRRGGGCARPGPLRSRGPQLRRLRGRLLMPTRSLDTSPVSRAPTTPGCRARRSRRACRARNRKRRSACSGALAAASPEAFIGCFEGLRSLRDPAGPARERGDQRPSPAAGPPLFDPPGRQSLLDDGRSACVRAPSRRVLDEGDPKAR